MSCVAVVSVMSSANRICLSCALKLYIKQTQSFILRLYVYLLIYVLITVSFCNLY